ncbi:MAG: mobile mystery protein B [Terracidiphilus sp.]|jgi:Fic-DOC domain mobile mystery protein B
MRLLDEEDGKTPLSPEEQADLIPSLATREELNEWERQNILEAYGWALEEKSIGRRDPLTEPYVRELHKRMFDQTWKWAGQYRITEKNIGIPFYQIQNSLAALLGDVRFWLEHETYAPDEIAVRFHHRIVFIHPFSYGNGRHARLMADVLARRQGRPAFTWGGAELTQSGGFRQKYIEALRAADKNEIDLLIGFARS